MSLSDPETIFETDGALVTGLRLCFAETSVLGRLEVTLGVASDGILI